MDKQYVKIDTIKENPKNPRSIRDEKFERLVTSLSNFPEMLEARPIVVNAGNVVLGGNMRLRACKALGMKKIWVVKAEDLTEDEQTEFMIKDNVNKGDWDWTILANEWQPEDLRDWGMDVWVPDTDSDFVPTTEPTVDTSQVTENDIQFSQEKINAGLGKERKDFVDCTCPHCSHQFKVLKKQ